MTITVVQSAQNLGNDSSTGNPTVTVTLGSPTTAGNCLLVAVLTTGTGNNPAVSGITLGSSGDTFTSLISNGSGTSDVIAAIFADPGCSGGQTTVTVTTSGGSGTGYMNVSVLEVSGLVTSAGSLLDKSSGATGSGSTSWSSGTTATTTQAAEFWIGCGGTYYTATITGPSSPWTNLATQDGPQLHTVAGYQVTSATGTATYSGTFSVSENSGAVVVTLKGASGSAPSGTVPVLMTARTEITGRNSTGRIIRRLARWRTGGAASGVLQAGRRHES